MPRKKQTPPAPEQPKPIDILVGQRLNYVMRDGSIRPLDVVRVWSDTCVNGVLLFDGSNDDGNIPSLSEDHPLPHTDITISPHYNLPLPVLWLTSVMRDDGKAPGTWHLDEDGEASENPDMTALLSELQTLKQQVAAMIPKDAEAKVPNPEP